MLPSLNVKITADPSAAKTGFKEIERSVDALDRATLEYQTRLTKLEASMKAGLITEKAMAKAANDAATAYKKAATSAASYAGATVEFSNATKVASKNMAAASGHNANIVSQFNDIAVMMAAGQNPLMLAMQQGTQLNQIFTQMGGKPVNALRGVAAGLMGMINPMSLVTLGVIAGGAALVQYAASALGAGEENETFADTLQRVSEMTSSLRDTQGILEMSVDELTAKYGEYADTVRDAASALLELQIAQVKSDMRDSLREMDEVFRRYTETQGGLLRSGTMLSTALRNAREDFGMTKDAAWEFVAALDELESAPTFDEQQAALMDIVDLLKEAGVDLQDMEGPLAEALRRTLELQIGMSELAAQADNAADAVAGIAAELNALPVTTGTPIFKNRSALEGLLPEDGFNGRGSGIPKARKRSGGGGGKSEEEQLREDMVKRLEALREGLATEQETIAAAYQEQMNTIADAWETNLITQKDFEELSLRSKQEFNEAWEKLEREKQNATLDAWGGMFGDLSSLMSSENKKLFNIGKAAAIAEATVNGYKAAVSAWDKGMAVGGPTVAAAFTAASLAKTGAMISNIASTNLGSSGGGSSSGGSSAAATAAAAESSQGPLQVGWNAMNPNELITVGMAQKMFEMISDEAGDRGFTIMRTA